MTHDTLNGMKYENMKYDIEEKGEQYMARKMTQDAYKHMRDDMIQNVRFIMGNNTTPRTTYHELSNPKLVHPTGRAERGAGHPEFHQISIRDNIIRAQSIDRNNVHL